MYSKVTDKKKIWTVGKGMKSFLNISPNRLGV